MKNSRIKILLIRLSSIGDILLTTPFIRQIRNKYPDAKIDFLIKKEFYDLIKYNPHLNKIFQYDSVTGIDGLKVLINKFRENQYSHILDLHNNYRSKFIRSKVKNIFQSRIKKDKIKRALLVFFKLNLYKEIITIPERYRKVGKSLDIEDDNGGLELTWSDEQDKALEKIVKDNRLYSNIIILAPGAGHFTKRWPLTYFKELISMLQKKGHNNIVILGSLEEKDEFDDLVQGDRIINLAGKLSLLESAALIKGSSIVISNDSGLMHMASAVGTPVIALFGSTVEELGFFPYRSPNFVFENKKLNCRPCSHLGKNKCPKEHFLCMKAITPQEVYEKIKEMTGII